MNESADVMNESAEMATTSSAKSKPNFDLAAFHDYVADLDQRRAEIEAKRMAVDEKLRALQTAPPNKADLKTILRRITGDYTQRWCKDLIVGLDLLKNSGDHAEYTERQIRNFGNAEQKGWAGLLGYAMTHFVDQFVDELDWPDDAPPIAEREAQIAEVNSSWEAFTGQMAEIDEQFAAIHLAPQSHA